MFLLQITIFFTAGYSWKSISLAAFTSTVKWKSISTVGSGRLVAMYDTGELFYLDINKNTATGINLPPCGRLVNIGY